MKNIILIITLLASPLFIFAQNAAIEQFYNKYTELENVTNITIEGGMLKFIASYVDDETGEKLVDKVTKLRLMIMDDSELVSKSDRQALRKGIRQQKFEDLMQIRDGNSKINILIQEQGDKVTNVLLLVDDEDSFILLSLEGSLDWEDFNHLNIEMEGAEHLKRISKDRA